MSDSFHEQMDIIRQRRADRANKVAQASLSTIKNPLSSGRFNSRDNASRFITTPAKKKAPTANELNARWCELIAKEIESTGCNRIDATSRVAKRHPKLRAAMVQASNQERSRGRRRV
jgi:hypothetical protein